jgi:hypothetical protein
MVEGNVVQLIMKVEPVSVCGMVELLMSKQDRMQHQAVMVFQYRSSLKGHRVKGSKQGEIETRSKFMEGEEG